MCSFTSAEWPEIKRKGMESGNLPFGQVPLLTYNGVKISQSHSILRWIARFHGQYGNLTSPEEWAQIDQFADSTEDLRKKLMAIKYGGGRDDEKEQMYRVHHKEVYPIWIGYFERLHIRYANKSAAPAAYIAGTQDPTFADFLLFDLVDTHRLLVEPALKTAGETIENGGGFDPFIGAPSLEQWYERILVRPQIRDYLKSERRR